MKLIGTDEILGFLGNHAVFGRQKLWAYRSVQNIKQDGGKLFFTAGVCIVADQMADESLGDGAVYGVHGHVITVVGCPSECELREISGSDYDAAGLVGDVHEHLRPLSGLTVLIGNIVNVDVVADVAEVKRNRLVEADLAEGDAELANEGAGVLIGTVGGAEAGHGDGDDAFSWKIQHVKSFYGYQKGERGIQAAGNADHRVRGMDVVKPFFQPHGLNG